ncbi:photosystem II protein Psb27 [Leptolyngbya valderiana BDU 20041]|uniref:photosystem II protein Psb27 n=1 Tax=Baaleninema simplex TaxID=2862350 RepID=UPI0003456FD9|nr:photosystem II protein Psb27 [Baaleninema simplex]MDC0832709.1 photosystem II protein Psb27 [Geitlerinema sp. CS-897]OAB61540.1 photosystem II protein Psb27 [Leptolyngbya valderiana BDU 20041]PPT07449.1 Photosystem II protein Psb27 [Geitlerinema sp. FC II]
MNRLLSRLFALLLVVVVGLVGCSPGANLSGNYSEDTLALVNSLRTAIELPEGTPEKMEAQAEARQNIDDFFSLYRRDPSVSSLPSFTTMRTALDALAGHYRSYGNRPLSSKLKQRLEQEFRQVEAALKRGA